MFSCALPDFPYDFDGTLNGEVCSILHKSIVMCVGICIVDTSGLVLVFRL